MNKIIIKDVEYFSLDSAVDIEDFDSSSIIFTDSSIVCDKYSKSGEEFPFLGLNNIFMIQSDKISDSKIFVPNNHISSHIDLGMYTHYRGENHRYLVLGVSLDVISGREFVLYSALYPFDRFSYGQLFYREKNPRDGVDAFTDNVVKPEYNYKGPRFRFAGKN